MMVSSPLLLCLSLAAFAGSICVGIIGSVLARRHEDHQLARERLTVGFARVVPLPFDPPAAAPEFEPTQLGGVCPIGAAAPKTVTPGSLSDRLAHLRVPA